MKRATIIYWFAGTDLRKDGGGMRAMAWQTALETLGYESTIEPLTVIGASGGAGSFVSRAKRRAIPMPFERSVPESHGADLVVATVPAVFRSAARTVPRNSLIFDWMDRWSANARNMGLASPLSVPGGVLQSRLWLSREARLPVAARANAFAGYEDYTAMRHSPRDEWVPNPLPFPDQLPARAPEIRRRLGFIGSLNYPPNEVSLKHFFDRYSSRLRESGIEVVVAGFGSERVRDWNVGATVLGEIADPLELYSQVDAAIVPIEHGGGIKIKAIEAMAYGLPVFATDHVRDGFSPEFRSWILDIDDLFSAPIQNVPISKEQFMERFSQNAFTAAVERMIHA